jgi:arylsulfatase A-like enzyme
MTIVSRMPRHVSRKNVCLTVIGVSIALLMTGCRLLRTHQAKSGKRPSAVLIVVDTLRADHLSSYGYFRKTTPNIDALAEVSLVYKNALAHAPWTTPSIASLFTSRHPAALGYVGEEPIELDRSFVPLADVFKYNGYATKAVVSHDFIGSKLKFDKGFDSFDQTNARGYGYVSSAAVTDAALAYVKEHARDEFFLFLHYFDPHFDYILHPEFDYDPGYRGPIRSGEYKDSLLEKGPLMTGEDRRHLIALYDSEISFTDKHIGRLFDSLRKLDLFDSSLIVLTADHGEEFSERADHWIGHTKKLYHDMIHVPLIIKVPQGSESRTVEESVGLIDVTPTIVARLGLKTPRAYAFMGRRIDLPDTTELESRPIYSETTRWANLQSVTWKNWKFICDLRQDAQELYDLASDPQETRDLAANQPLICGEYRTLLWGWRAEMAEARSGIKPVSKVPVFDEAEKARLRSLGYIK